MQLPEFDMSRARWDRFKAFHVGHRGEYWTYDSCRIVQFDTGEIIVTSRNWKPADRYRVKDQGYGIFGSTDANVPLMLTPEGEPVKRTWLAGPAQQMLLVDYNTGRVVALGRGDWAKDIPVRLRTHACAYLAGNGEPPLGKPIAIIRPNEYTKEQRDHVRGLVDQCKAWLELSDQPTPATPKQYYTDADRISVAYLLDKEFKDLPQATCLCLALAGTRAGTRRDVHPYLTLKEGGAP